MTAILERLDKFVAGLDRAALADAAVRSHCMPKERAEHLLDTYLGEMPTGLRIIEPHLTSGQRILEVGSGIGVLSAFLMQEGFEIIGLEPGNEGGFSFMTVLHRAVADQLPKSIQPEILAVGAEDLTPAEHGRFDLIFSANVLEHISALEVALPAMRDVLAHRGVMRHLCPNYLFPYEPHLGIPLIPFAPQATRHLVPGVIARNREIWDGINFISAWRIAQLAHQCGLEIKFDRGVMGHYMRRMNADATFAERHMGVMRLVARKPYLVAGLARMLEAMPPSLASPMALTLRHA